MTPGFRLRSGWCEIPGMPAEPPPDPNRIAESNIADTAAFRRFVDDDGAGAAGSRDRGVGAGPAERSSGGPVFGTASSVIGVVLLVAVPVLLLVAGDAAGRASGDKILAAAAWVLLGLAVVVCVAGFLRDRRAKRPVDVLDLIVVFAAVVGAVVIAVAM
jgi:hypothetical protein